MTCNDQVTRQWFLLRKLENMKGATLQELAEALPEGYPRHPRAIRRDLEALEARFPFKKPIPCATAALGGIAIHIKRAHFAFTTFPNKDHAAA